MSTNNMSEQVQMEMLHLDDCYVVAPAGSDLLKKGFDRRTFMKGAGLMVVGLSVSGATSLASAGSTAEAAEAGSAAAALADVPGTQVDSYITIGEDNNVTFFISRMEHGQGIVTGLMQIVAEDLDVSFARMRSVVIADTGRVANDGGIAGSAATATTGPKLRRMAAAARLKLLDLAAARFGVTVDKLTVNDAVISVVGDATKSVTYGQLIAGKQFALEIPAADKITTKPIDQYKIVGQPIARVDIPGKLTGEYEFVGDLRLPGMVHARSVRPKGQAYRQFFELKSVDEKSISGVKGLIKMVVVTDMHTKTGFNGNFNFVGIVTEREEQAIEASAKLKVEWGKAPVLPADLYNHLFTVGRTATPAVGGDINAALASASKVVEATYKYPLQMHAPFGSLNTVADVKVGSDGKVTFATVWSGTQNVYSTRTTIGNALDIPTAEIPDKVRIIWRSPAGTYGTNAVGICDVDAALLSRAVGRPVRVQWTREDSHGYDYFGPLHLFNVKAGLDSSGNIIAWDFDSWGAAPEGAMAGQRYAFGVAPANFRRIGAAPTGGYFFNQSFLRAPNALANGFATEQFIDEMAAAAKKDPIQYRLAHLDRTVLLQSRVGDTLLAAAEKFGWVTRPSPNPANASNRTGVVRGRGIAHGGFANTFVSEVAEVEVNQATGAVRVLRMVAAQDCGLIVNPESVKQQIEGNVAQATGRALWEEVKVETTEKGGSRISSLDWVTYPILRISELPKTETVLLNRKDLSSTGVGEPASVPVPAAIANAIFDATGARVRQAPLTPANVKAALDARK